MDESMRFGNQLERYGVVFDYLSDADICYC